MILACKNITKSFGITPILDQVNFHLEEGEKAGLVGINGAGKTTLFRILAGELSADEGQVIKPSNKHLDYLSQQQNLQSELTIYDEMLEAKKDILDLQNQMRALELKMKEVSGETLEHLMNDYALLQHRFEALNGYAFKSEIEGVLKGLGFQSNDHMKKIHSLSGGEKTRVALAKILLVHPDILLLDEPTNHLDMKAIKWLEGYINTYKGTLLIISHDRYFLDKTVTKIIELENTKCKVYLGNYTHYANKKAIDRDIQLKHYLNQQKEIQRQETIIEQLRSFNREKSIKRARSREKNLEKMERIDKPVEVQADMRLHLEPRILSGNDVLSIKDLSKSFGDRSLFQSLSLDIKRGEKVALIGDNGTGKTTLFRLILDQMKPDIGEIRLGAKVNCGYYDQEHGSLEDNHTLIEELSETYPTLKTSEIRNILAAFLFTGEDVFKKISQLSGGEKGRISLAKLMLSESNFLLLDEPTNHLDITSKEILESTLNNYTGTILYISHDRYFINKTADRILELTPSGVINYLGNYDYYLEKKADLETSIEPYSTKTVDEGSSKIDWLRNKEKQALERKRLADLAKIEEAIHTIEASLQAIDEQLCLEEVYTSHDKLMALNEAKKAQQDELETLLTEWEKISEALE